LIRSLGCTYSCTHCNGEERGLKESIRENANKNDTTESMQTVDLRIIKKRLTMCDMENNHAKTAETRHKAKMENAN
jgi:hypothetical protein